MAEIFPFRALRYNPRLVPPSLCVTQPYDKISPAMQTGYYAASPYNLVRVILGRREAQDNTEHNVYTRAAADFRDWRASEVLRQDTEPGIYAYSERFKAPGTDTELERRGFIALGRIEDYSAKVVFRHEQTLAKPKADRLDLLRATRAHFGQIFMLYEGGSIDSLISAGTQRKPVTTLEDEDGVRNSVWKISDPAAIARIQALMADKKLLIADGHHRYETALAYRDERRASAGGKTSSHASAPHDFLMMTFVSMSSPGLLILPTHRVVHGLVGFSADDFTAKSSNFFEIEEVDPEVNAERAVAILRDKGKNGTALLAVMAGRVLLLHHPMPSGAKFFSGLSERQRGLDVVQLHKCLLEGVLGLSEESIRNQQNLSYVREVAQAIEQVHAGKANVAFLMNPCRVEQVRDVAFASEVMPQKSTDFYPKLLSGLTIYALE